MGVWAAQHEQLNQRIVLKQLHAQRETSTSLSTSGVGCALRLAEPPMFRASYSSTNDQPNVTSYYLSVSRLFQLACECHLTGLNSRCWVPRDLQATRAMCRYACMLQASGKSSPFRLVCISAAPGSLCLKLGQSNAAQDVAPSTEHVWAYTDKLAPPETRQNVINIRISISTVDTM